MTTSPSRTRLPRPLRRALRPAAVLVAAVVCVASMGITAPPASADVTYYPGPSHNWNGKKVYLSQACHDGNDGVPGGSCITNHGCGGFSENYQSRTTALHAITGQQKKRLNLLERGYRVRRGTGTVNQNINRSNNFGSTVHVPIHSNARTEGCGNANNSQHGTLMLYVSTKGKNCSGKFVNWFGPGSPGTADRRTYRSNLGELNSTTGTACYLESEFHTWGKGVRWLRNEHNYSWRVGRAIDAHLGYPR